MATVHYLVVAGGGGGGRNNTGGAPESGGGGGAGGHQTGSYGVVSGSSYTITIGAGAGPGNAGTNSGWAGAGASGGGKGARATGGYTGGAGLAPAVTTGVLRWGRVGLLGSPQCPGLIGKNVVNLHKSLRIMSGPPVFEALNSYCDPT